ncbi:type-2 restriction enzyme TthHB8I [Thermus thermophilus]|nr:type-2 restriction enzyme TthHB8I [Thermus thermophilus]BDG24529.1 type-2 restriction enzyme TthHB8I [Thermus thermophilus]BDG25798.1 type-2 restriction enzyme TthHB8I [Thermus thermophilus]
MAPTQAQKVLEAFEDFLKCLDLESYQEKYRPIKTVEQDLPRELNPLPDLYDHYWKPNGNTLHFPDFETFFDQWWEKRLRPLNEFIRKYFWGCSYEFVRLGLEARLYRTAVSIWTQFHFCYRWNASCGFPLTATPELDAQGVDALIQVGGHQAGIQIKKETYRSEARGDNRFLRKLKNFALLEVPYTLQSLEEILKRAERARTKKETHLLWARVAHHLGRLPNGFVIFQESYVKGVERFLQENAPALSGIISWERVAQEALTGP